MYAHRRHDISDRVWENIQAHLPGKKGSVGRPAGDNRLFINAVFWILRTGAPWRDLPPDLGDWKNTHRRFCRWRDRGVWEKLLEVLMVEPDYEWLMIDASHCKVHPHAAGAVGGNQAMSRTKGGSTPKYIWPWMRMVCRSELLLQKVPELIARKRAHCIDGLSAEALLTDPGYDSNELIDKAVESGCQPVIPPKKNRREQRDYDKALYRVRHLVENAFLHLKRWRGIATRYAKRSLSFLAAVQIRCISLWAEII